MFETVFFIASIALLHFLAVVSPGPDFFMIVNNSLKFSRKTGIWTAVGLGLGIACHILYCVAGVALLISKSILIFNIIKFLGAGYLVYIGIKSLKAHSDDIDIKKQEHLQDITPFQSVKIGFLTNILNPKVTLFFLSLFTLVITPDTSSTVLAIISTIMVLDTIIWFSLVATFFTHKKVYSIYSRFQDKINKAFGGFLILLGLKVAISTK